MPKKCQEYLKALVIDGVISNETLIQTSYCNTLLSLFKQTNAVKISKKTKSTPFSVVKSQNGRLFALYNPSKGNGIAKGAQGIIVVAQDILTKETCLAKIQKVPLTKKNNEIDSIRKEVSFIQRNELLYGYQERIDTDKNVTTTYIFMKELPGLPVSDENNSTQCFETLYAKKLTEAEKMIILRNLLINFMALSKANIIHKDLYPRNILIDPLDNFKVYFVDWGKSLEMNNEGIALGYAEHDFQKKKPVKYANGADFLTLTDTFLELNLLDNNVIGNEVRKIVKTCGDLKSNYQKIDVSPLIHLIEAELSEKHKTRFSND